MLLNLKDIIHVNGGRIPFEYQLDLSDLSFYGYEPVMDPVNAVGEVYNEAGMLVLSAELTTILSLRCDRCGTEFRREKIVEVRNLVADHLDNEDSEDNEDILLLNGNDLDLDDALVTAFILDMDTKILCREDCKGLCAGCGADLNFETCRCKKESDPRLAVLAKLLEQKS